VKHLIVITYVARTDIVLIVVSIAVAAVIYVVATCRTRIVPIVVQISGIGVLIAIVVIATIPYGAEAIA
jgi:type IV secretory pathway TrbF-like protein